VDPPLTDLTLLRVISTPVYADSDSCSEHKVSHHIVSVIGGIVDPQHRLCDTELMQKYIQVYDFLGHSIESLV
jgi:hypothetical protein